VGTQQAFAAQKTVEEGVVKLEQQQAQDIIDAKDDPVIEDPTEDLGDSGDDSEPSTGTQEESEPDEDPTDQPEETIETSTGS
jgi:hypothetical protein